MGTNHHKHYRIAFWITLIVSILLIVGGFVVPPTGIVHGSVLTAVGELVLWPALAFGYAAICEGKTAHISKGNLDITIGEDNNNEDENEEA